MPGRSSGSWLLWALPLLLLSGGSSAAVPIYDGPTLPDGWYPIHETELIALEENSETIGILTTTLRTMFGAMLETVNEWQTESIERTTRIEQSLDASDRAVEAIAAENRRIRTELWIYRVGGGALVATTLYLTIRLALAPP